MEQGEDDTAALASIGDVADCTARADTQVRAVLGRVMAQQRSAAVALDYVMALSPGTRSQTRVAAVAAAMPMRMAR